MKRTLRMLTLFLLGLACVASFPAGVAADENVAPAYDRVAELEQTVAELQGQLARLEEQLARLESLLLELLGQDGAAGDGGAGEADAGEGAREEQAQHEGDGPGRSERARDPIEKEKSESSAPSLAGAAWKRMSQNWEYRNAGIRWGTFRDAFIIELRRIGPPISSAMMTVTLYDEEGRIVATGTGSVLNMATGEVRTVDFWLDASPEEARTWRLQVDFEF